MASSGHDISDIFLDLMKMANYLKVEGAHGYYVTEICFVLNTYVSWPYLRLYVFPLHIIWGTLPRRPAAPAPDSTHAVHPSPTHMSRDLRLCVFPRHIIWVRWRWPRFWPSIPLGIFMSS